MGTESDWSEISDEDFNMIVTEVGRDRIKSAFSKLANELYGWPTEPLEAHTKEKKLSEDYKVQVSGNIGEGLFVFRGQNQEELNQQARDTVAGLSEFYNILSEAKQIVSVKEVFTAKKQFGGNNGGGNKSYGGSNTGQRSGGSGSQQGGGSSEGVTQAPDGSFTCSHGKMKLLDYKKADGTRVHGHYCQAPRNATDKHKPQTLPGHGDK